MSETNFEKNVQHEMLGFKLKPSEEVWTKVEERIRKKKRRRFIFILFFAGLALLGYWQRDLLFSEKETAATEPVTLPQKKISIVDSIKTIIPENINKEVQVRENTEKNKNALTKNQKQIDPVKGKIFSVKNEKQIIKTPDIVVARVIEISVKPTIVPDKSIIEQSKETHIEQSKEAQILKDSSTVSIAAENKINDSKEISVINSDTLISKEIEKISENKVQKDTIQKVESKADSLVEMKKLPAISKKWKWGVQLTPGIATFVDQFILISSQKSADFAGAPSGPIPTPPASPSERKSGFAFQLTGFAQKRISAKTEFSIGVQYGYYSDRIQVGDSRLLSLSASQPQPLFGVTQGYRAANPNISITNRYHFLELPMEFLFQLNKKPTKPFYLNLGLTAGQLISTNALVYDTSFGGIYFDGKKQLNKTQFSLTTGFLWAITAKKLQWSVGPVINVHINRFQDNSFENDKYLLMPGIRTKIIFPDKK